MTDSPPDTADYAELKRILTRAGLFERQPVYFALKFVTLAALFAVCIALLFAAPGLPAWLLVPNAAFAAIVFGQLGLLGHDVGHGQVFRSSRLTTAVGLVLGNLLLGIGRG